MDRPLIWSEAFAVGHDELDQQHRHLVMLINELGTSYGATRDTREIARGLRPLTEAATKHMRHETLVLRQFGQHLQNGHATSHRRAILDARIEDHIADHDTLENRLEEITEVVNGNLSVEGVSLCRELEMWFLDHAVRYDLKLKAIIESMHLPS